MSLLYWVLIGLCNNIILLCNNHTKFLQITFFAPVDSSDWIIEREAWNVFWLDLIIFRKYFLSERIGDQFSVIGRRCWGRTDQSPLSDDVNLLRCLLLLPRLLSLGVELLAGLAETQLDRDLQFSDLGRLLDCGTLSGRRLLHCRRTFSLNTLCLMTRSSRCLPPDIPWRSCPGRSPPAGQAGSTLSPSPYIPLLDILWTGNLHNFCL